KAKLGPDNPQTSKAEILLALAYRDSNRLDQAIPMLEGIVKRINEKVGNEHLEALVATNHLVKAYLDARSWTEAEAKARECLETLTRRFPEEWQRFSAMSQLGAALAGRKGYKEAEPLLIEGYEGMKAREGKIGNLSKKYLTDAAARIAPFY